MKQTRMAKYGCALLSGFVAAAVALAQVPTQSAPAIASLTSVEVAKLGKPPSGPQEVIVEQDPDLATHTIYRPKNLGSSKFPVVVWGEGGCAKVGTMFPEFLSEIASHGFIVVADGPPAAVGAGPGTGFGGGGGLRSGGVSPGGGPPRGGAPGGMSLTPDGTALIQALDWVTREAAKPGSRFQNKVDTTRVAAMGQSCGGLMSYGASSDPRITTLGILNSGLINADPALLGKLHSSVLILTGNESDVAYANGKRDFETMPTKVPAFHGVYPSVGHSGTFTDDNGGAFAVTAVAWLKWQLQGDKGPAGRGYFVGDACGICKDSTWIVQSRSLP